jgi:L-seryl-tRNA(Ser) seleniumtransferase
MTLSVPPRRRLPSVEALLQHAALSAPLTTLPRALVVEAVRTTLAAERLRLGRGGEPPTPDALAAAAARHAQAAARPALVRVLNATGVVLHTNLGRAPLAPAARRAIEEAARGYCSLELDLESGRRGDRGLGIERWLVRLTGAEAALAVNNGAAAVLLALSTLAAGRAIVVSRGELVEIGGSFRIPEILERSGARLVEVGTTNRTHLRDYTRALERHRDVAAILRVHPSNFRIEGFTTRPELAGLVALAQRRRVPLIEDLGSGAFVDLASFGLEHEPTAAESLAAGCDVVTCSGDKLLGGAQAGFVLGRARWVERMRRDPLARALRLDKLQLAALEATLPLYAEPGRAAREVPVLAMLSAPPAELEARARRLAGALGATIPGLAVRVLAGMGEVGGGSLPRQRLPGFVVELAHPALDAAAMERRARAADPPVLGTIRARHWRLDPRTLADEDIPELVTALARAFRTGGADGAAPGSR